jgi:hypothetical protein
MSWNYRVMRHTDPKTQEEYFSIHSVYYDENNKPNGYGDPPYIVSDTTAGLEFTLAKMLECLLKPILTESDCGSVGQLEDHPPSKRVYAGSSPVGTANK